MRRRTGAVGPAGALGVSRFDVTCGRRSPDAAVDVVRRWAQDRALPSRAAADLCLLTSAALAHGLRSRPGSVTISLRWADPDRVHVEVAWHALGDERPEDGADSAVRASENVMDTIAESWGVEQGVTPRQWMVLDTSPPEPGRRI